MMMRYVVTLLGYKYSDNIITKQQQQQNRQSIIWNESEYIFIE